MTAQNGTAPPQPQEIQAHPEAIRQALTARNTKLRDDLRQTEDNLDAVNAAYITAQHSGMELAVQNSRLQGENVRLRELCNENGIDLVKAGIDPAPQTPEPPTVSEASEDTPGT